MKLILLSLFFTAAAPLWLAAESPTPPQAKAEAEGRACYLGVVTCLPSAEMRRSAGLAEGFGLVIESLFPAGPAEKAGLQKQDLLIRYNQQELVNPQQLRALVHSSGAGATVQLTLIRKGAQRQITVQLQPTVAATR
jgi:S1-C subfamily serine protease